MSGAAVQSSLKLSEAGTDYSGFGFLGVAAIRISTADDAWAHSGILYRDRRAMEVRLFHLRTHQQLCDELAPDVTTKRRMAWVEPRVPIERAQLVVAKCRLVLKRHGENAVPYSFRYERSSFDERGILHLGRGETGFTCATIVAAIFASEQLRLIEPTTWPPPGEKDLRGRQTVIDAVRRSSPDHARLMQTEIGAPRVRPEEVVAAGAVHPTVGTFESLREGAAHVSAAIGL